MIEKICTDCNYLGPQKDFPMYSTRNKIYYRNQCKKCYAVRKKNYKTSTPVVALLYGEKMSCKKCDIIKPLGEFYPSGSGYVRRTCKECYDEKNSLAIRSQEKRKQCLEAYGSKCMCCNESESVFLTFDYINEDGAKHRETTRAGYSFYKWLIDNDYPDTIQILCYNCNWAKYRGICPHNMNTVLSERSL